MSETIMSDRRATWAEVAAWRAQLRDRALSCGVTDPRLRADGAVIMHPSDAGFQLNDHFGGPAPLRGDEGQHI
ncbi:hypothetical protein [Paenarthrobacter sp. PH39-S1]|uniref:hypothetical protein n=1 Tax=Paenarthrobacter sp. PH39-S1 TaxID=3046204 RepID=UPI0024B9AE3D|nr:hypothetical protein [Paenarthrobacter sp. PH39-S1]MDJ0355824.1 hypothetical protein [Paenarthrobacter sp. PH39-S1]